MREEQNSFHFREMHFIFGRRGVSVKCNETKSEPLRAPLAVAASWVCQTKLPPAGKKISYDPLTVTLAC
jgi:hypothetical protein